MTKAYSQATEDYLKTIYEITESQGRASTNQIAEVLSVNPASVTGMIKKMSEADPPLVDYQKHQGVVLTTAGEMAALEIVRHHRLIEMYLHEVLGYRWDEVHNEADMLEHYISERFEERIAQALGHPTHDPHGDPIPTRELVVPESIWCLLYELRPGQQAVIQRVLDEDPMLLQYLAEMGLVPQADLSIVGYSPIDENISLRVTPHEAIFTLGPRITRQIYVEVKEDD